MGTFSEERNLYTPGNIEQVELEFSITYNTNVQIHREWLAYVDVGMRNSEDLFMKDFLLGMNFKIDKVRRIDI